MSHGAGNWRWLVFCGALLLNTSLLAQLSQKEAFPSEFYVVSEVFSDAAPFWSYYILELRPDGDDSMARYIRIARLDANCSAVTVKAAEVRLRNVSPASLVANNNPCAVSPRALGRAVRANRRRETISDTVRFGIVAKCSDRETVFHLPYPEEVNLDNLKRKSPQIARLWDFTYEVASAAFGEASVFRGISKERDTELQRVGQLVVPDLMSGRYDKGLSPQCSAGQEPPCEKWGYRDLLQAYRGPQELPNHAPQLLGADHVRFTNYVDPVYPPLAKQARIKGKVELQLTVDPQTGEVLRANALSGHPLLKQSAVTAAEKWRVDPGSALTGTIPVVLDYAFRCP